MADIIRGTEIKFNLNIEPIDNVNMSSYDFEVKFYCSGSSQSVIVHKDNCIQVDTDNYTVPLDTAGLALGALIADIYAHIPDFDFSDNLRTEIHRVQTDITIIQ